MFPFRIILLVASFETICILAGKNDPGTASSTSNESSTVLPLVLIKSGHSLLNPTTLDSANFVKEGDFLSAQTTFSTSLQGTTLIFNCAVKEISNNASQDSHLSRKSGSVDTPYCTYPVKYNPTDPLRCPEEPEPIANRLYSPPGPDLPLVKCGPGKRGNMYWFAYKTCMTKNANEYEKLQKNDLSGFENNPITYRTYFEVYKICYDEDEEEILYTKHRIMSPKLLFNNDMKQEWNKEYEMSTEGYYSFKDHFKSVKDAYIKLKNLSSSNPDKYPYQPQKLVPSEDMPFALWQKPTYHFLNVKPIHKKLVPLWEHINELIRRIAHDREIQYNIFTGAFPIPETDSKFNIDNVIQAPDVWIKIIHRLCQGQHRNCYNAIAVIMVEDLNNETVATFYENACGINLCENTFVGEFPEISKFVKCCPVTKEIDAFFETNLFDNSELLVEYLFNNMEQLPIEGV